MSRPDSESHASAGDGKGPVISVVIPAHDAAPWLAETVGSLVAQTWTRWEAVIVDDGSTDATAEVAEALSAEDTRVRVLRRAASGVSAARNAGIAAATAPWLLFLDADDLLLPAALETFMAAVARDPGLDLVYAGWERLLADGRRVDGTWSVAPAELFGVFARTCAFAIHACVVRRSLVEAVGGFDESLVTCEDWDLWQRLTRVGARAHELKDRVALYRLRRRSASGNGFQLIEDGMVVIARGHGQDDRVQAAQPFLLGADPRQAPHARAGLVAFGVGLTIGAGGDPEALYALNPDWLTPGLDAASLGSIVAIAAAIARAQGVGDWPAFGDELWRAAGAAFERFAELTQVPYAAQRAARGHREAILAAVEGAQRPLRVGPSYAVELDAARPLADLDVPDDAERVSVRVMLAGEALGTVSLPAVGGPLPAWLLADAVAGEHSWALLRGWFVGRAAPEERDATARRFDAEGWTMVLREMFGDEHLTPDELYDLRGGPAAPEHRAAPGAAATTVELAGEIPVPRSHDEVFGVTLGGEPLLRLRLPAEAPLTAHALRAAIVAHAGYELGVALARVAIIGHPLDGPGLRERLVATAAPPAPPAVHPRVGRRPGTVLGDATSRRALLPAALRADLLADAAAVQAPVDEAGDARGVVYDPAYSEPPFGASPALDLDLWVPEGSRPEDFEQRFERPERRGRSAYDEAVDASLLSLLPDGRLARVLQIGCADGSVTERLAGRAERLDVLDVARSALELARARVNGTGQATFRRHDVFADALQDGRWDAIVCRNVLHHAPSRTRLERAIAQIRRGLGRGGVLITAHAELLTDDPDKPGFDWGFSYGGRIIGNFLSTAGLELDHAVVAEGVRIQRWRAPRGAIVRRLRPPRTSWTAMELPPLPPAEAAAWRPDGGVPQRPRRPASTRSVPIIMYHRVAESGSDATAAWRVTPGAFADQLDHLREAGYHTITLQELARFSAARVPIPGRPVVLTFDDAYEDFAQTAWPLIKERGFGATLFPVADLTGGMNVWDQNLDEELPLLDWDALRALRAEGVEIGSHSATHPPLTALSPVEVARELLRSRAATRRELGFTPTTIAYPFGDADEVVRRVAGAVGFVAGVTTDVRVAHVHDDALMLPRIDSAQEDGDALAARIAQARSWNESSV